MSDLIDATDEAIEDSLEQFDADIDNTLFKLTQKYRGDSAMSGLQRRELVSLATQLLNDLVAWETVRGLTEEIKLARGGK